MSNIAEALVATAVGLVVAIPAVAANNYYQRMIKSTLANTEALTSILLAHLKSEPTAAAAAPAPVAAAKAPAAAAKASAAKTSKKAEPVAETDEEES